MKLSAYQRTKPSGVEWLGDVPEHWDALRLKRRFNVVNGGTPSSSEEAYWDGNISWFTPEDLGRNASKVIAVCRRQLSLEGLENCGASLCQPGSVVVSTRAPIGHVAITGVVSCCNQGARILVPLSDETDADFAYYALIASKGVLQSAGKGTTFLELSAGALGAHHLPIPEPAEQRAIAAFLDRETGRIDVLVGKKQALIERLKEKRTALISRTVTRGLPPAAAKAAGVTENPPLKPSGLEWLGDIPAHWEVKKLSWLFRYAKGPSAAMLTKEYVAENGGDYPVFSGQTENDGLMGMISWHEFDFSSHVIFVTTVGARAMSTRLVRGRFSLSQNCAIIIPRSRAINPAFYEAVLRRLFDYERRSISLIMQPSLRFDDLDKFRVPLPPPEEQSAIAAYLDVETAKLDVLVTKVETAIERLQEYRTALITAAVTGKIDVRKEAAA